MPNKINKSFYIHIKVITGSKKEFWKKKSEDHFEVSIKEKAERNMANNRVIELVANYFKVPLNKVRIINGHHHSSKLLIVEEN